MKVDRHEQDEARRDRIARAAFELFARSGLEATSAQDIARAAFVSRTNLYRYFPSKLHMLLAHFDKAVQASRDDALERLRAGANPQQVWDKVMARMADLGVRYRHLVGAVGQAVLGASPPGDMGRGHAGAGSTELGSTDSRATSPLALPARLAPADGLGTALTLGALVEPVLLAMQAQGRLRPDVNVTGLSALLVDACLLALLHGGHRDQREVLRDWQDRFSLLMSGALAPGAVVEGRQD